MQRSRTDRAVVWFVFFVFLGFIYLVASALYEKNQTNITDPNAYQYTRVFHPSSNSFLVARLLPISATLDISDSTSQAYEPILAVGGTPDDALGLWQFVSDTSTNPASYRIQNAYTGYYVSSIRPDIPLAIPINAQSQVDATNFVIRGPDSVAAAGANIRSPFTITLSGGPQLNVHIAGRFGLQLAPGTATTFVLRTPVTS